MRLTGKTAGITAVKLYQADQEVGELAFPTDKIIHLANYRSGIYTVRPIVNGELGTESFPFTIFTQHAPHHNEAPFSQEIPCSAVLKTLSQEGNAYGQLEWQVPNEFRFQPVKFTCNYIALDDTEKTETFTIRPNQLLIPHRDKNDHSLFQNIQFAEQVKAIKEISLALQVNTRSQDSEDEAWVTLYASIMPLPDKTLLQAKLASMQLKRIRLTAELLKTTQTLPEDNEIYTHHFPSTATLYVTPVADLIEQPMVVYRDTSLDLQADKKQIACTSITRNGFSIDVSGFQPGSYPFTVNDKEGVFTVTQGGIVFTSEAETINQKIIQQATRQFGYDAWNNRITDIDSLGHVTQCQYNFRNQLIVKTQPEVNVIHFTGGTDYEFRPAKPITTYGYNLRGFKVGMVDPNQHTQGIIVDSLGRTIVTILADGTRMSTVQYDALQRMKQRMDARNQVWSNEYDRNNNLLSMRSPLGKITNYGYNELGARNLESNAAQETRHYNFDAQSNVSARYEPLGQCTTMLYARGQMIQTTDPDGGVLTWKRDYFGVVQEHQDLSGATLYSEYNYNKQLIHEYGLGGNHGSYFKLTKVTKQEWLVPSDYPRHPAYAVTVDYYVRSFLTVPPPNIRYEYALGRVVKIHDVAGDKLTSYGYDTENRLTTAQITNLEDSILFRKVETQVDGLGREIYTHDGESTFITAYDLANNRRLVKAQIVSEEGQSLEKADSWWDYDVADRCILDNGVLLDGKIQLSEGRGIAYTYEQGLRKTESKIVASNMITATQTFDEDGFLVRSDISTGEYSTREYHPSGWQKRFTDVVQLEGPFTHINHLTQCNANGWVEQDFQTKDNNPQIQTFYQDYTESGLPRRQTTYYNDTDQHTTDYLYNSYVGGDSWRLSQVAGRRHNREGWSDVSTVNVYSGPNGEDNAIIGQYDADRERQNVFFEASSDGLIFTRLALRGHVQGDESTPYEVEKTKYFYSVQGLMVGVLKTTIDNRTFNKEIHMDTNLIKHGAVAKGMYELCPYNPAQAYQNGGSQNRSLGRWSGQSNAIRVYDTNSSTGLVASSVRRYGNLQINDFLRPSTFADPLLGKGDEGVSRNVKGSTKILGWLELGVKTITTTSYAAENGAALSPSSTIVQYGDDYESIAKRMKSDPNLAGLIADANGGLVLQAGRPVFIPQMILSQNKAGYARPYAELMALIRGNITPYLDTPEPDNEGHWLQIVISIVVCVIAFAVGGGILGAALVNALGTSSTVVNSLIVGVSAALVDAAAQGIAVGVGLQSQFSWQQVVEVGLSAGLSTGISNSMNAEAVGAEQTAGQAGQQALTKTLTIDQVAHRMLTVGTVSVATQLAEMAVGYRKQFDMAAVGSAVLGAGVDAHLSTTKLSDPYGLVSVGSHTLLDAGLHGQNPNLNLMAAQLLGQGLGAGSIQGGAALYDHIQRNNNSGNYDQSQQAAQGNALPGHRNPVVAAHRNNNTAKNPTHPSYRSKSYQDARAEQDLRDQLKIEIDPDQPINFENYGHNRAGFWNSNKSPVVLDDLTSSAARFGASLDGVVKTANKMLPFYNTNYERYAMYSRQALARSFEITSDIFFNVGQKEVPLWTAERNMMVRSFEYNSAIASKMSFFAKSAQGLALYGDKLGIGFELVSTAYTLKNTSPEQLNRTAFVEAAGIWGGKIFAELTVDAAVIQVIATDGFGFFPAAWTLSKVTTASMLGSTLFKTGAGLAYDFTQEIKEWKWNLPTMK